MTLIAAAVRGRFVSWRNRLAELFDACTRPTQANRDALFKLLSQALEVPGGATASSVPGVLRRPNLVRCEFEGQALENTLWQGGKAARQDSAKPGLSRRPAALVTSMSACHISREKLPPDVPSAGFLSACALCPCSRGTSSQADLEDGPHDSTGRLLNLEVSFGLG